jgi:hypothetical protein
MSSITITIVTAVAIIHTVTLAAKVVADLLSTLLVPVLMLVSLVSLF